jgi:lysophospholipase L1-like esterase
MARFLGSGVFGYRQLMPVAARRLALLAAFLGAACDNPNTPQPPPPPPPTLTITCPPSQTLEGVTGSGKEVTYPTPPTTGGTVPVAVACAPASGTAFQIGSTTVNCTARDAGTQQATCSFNVTLTARLLQIGKFMAFGDSLTEGENGIRVVLRRPASIIPGSPYPDQLSPMLSHEYPTQTFQVVNKGVSGRFAQDGAKDLPRDLAAERPEALLLLDGYNNLFGDCPAGGTINSKCLGAIDVVLAALSLDVSNGRSSGAKYVFVSTLTPPGPVTGPMDRRINGQAIVMLNDRIAATLPGQGAVLVDTYPRFLGHEAEYVSTDGLHLRPAGYEALARSFFDAINATIPSMAAVYSPLALGSGAVVPAQRALPRR